MPSSLYEPVKLMLIDQARSGKGQARYFFTHCAAAGQRHAPGICRTSCTCGVTPPRTVSSNLPVPGNQCTGAERSGTEVEV